jgi:hypothetical protein
MSVFAAEAATEEEKTQIILCSFALTGASELHQALFVCRTCSPDKGSTLCCCEACSEACHAEHDVEYVADGAGYCDCGRGALGPTCCLQERSREHAAALFPSCASASACNSDRDRDKDSDNGVGSGAHPVGQRAGLPSPLDFVEMHGAPALQEGACACARASQSL